MNYFDEGIARIPRQVSRPDRDLPEHAPKPATYFFMRLKGIDDGRRRHSEP
jgi:hypothetical protein